MDNKQQQNYSRTANTKTSNQTTDSSQKSSSDIQATKYWPKHSRRRENSTNSARNNQNNSTKSKQSSAKVRPNVDKRPRARGYNAYNSKHYGSTNYFAAGTGLGSGDVKSSDSSFDEASLGHLEHNDYKFSSDYASGTRKTNFNHLLNFSYTREVDCYDGFVGSSSSNGGFHSYNQRHGYVKKHKYNKEQFLQANFQFVIKASAKRKTDDSPDTLIDWSLIEQINIQTPEEPQCPICLYPPIAAKVTRCGHAYCWPCVLHYLSLSDKTWRKCPLCYDAIHVGDLKSATIVQQKSFNVNSYITFCLMRRKKGSFYIEKHDGMKNYQTIDKYPYVCNPEEEKLFSKFILAKRSDVADILSREQKELLADVDESCPEYVFIQQALNLLKERSELLGDIEQQDEEKYKTEKMCLNQNNINNKDIIDNSKVEEKPKDLKQSENSETLNEIIISNQNKKEEELSESSFNCASNSCYQSGSLQKNTKFYYFYQSDDGQNIFLHPLNVKMLQACYGSLSDAPATIKARIIQKEQHSMDEDHRRKFTCLGHLPLTCQFSVVEVELQPPYVTEDIIEAFKVDILLREKERQRRARKEREREKHINAINDRQMGKLIASAAKINITSTEEFPTCGFEESLVASGPDTLDNDPSTSKARRTKTISTSSAGSCSYSAIAIHCQKEHTPWSTLNAAQLTKNTSSDPPTNDDGETSTLSTTQTNLGDVLAQALLQKKEKKTAKPNKANNANTIGNGNKKSKKSKKMLPLFSTGMNFTGN